MSLKNDGPSLAREIAKLQKEKSRKWWARKRIQKQIDELVAQVEAENNKYLESLFKPQ